MLKEFVALARRGVLDSPEYCQPGGNVNYPSRADAPHCPVFGAGIFSASRVYW
jgi:hypothetical protein